MFIKFKVFNSVFVAMKTSLGEKEVNVGTHPASEGSGKAGNPQ